MRIPFLPAAFLMFASIPGSAADTMTPTPIAASPGTPSAASPASDSASAPTQKGLNAEIAALKTAFETTSRCFDEKNALKKDLDRKKASLRAEFKGKIPADFNDLLWQKTARMNKQHALCSAQYDDLGKRFTAIHHSFRTIEPKNQNIKRQKDEVDALKARFLQMAPTDKPYNKPAQRPAAPEAAE